MTLLLNGPKGWRGDITFISLRPMGQIYLGDLWETLPEFGCLPEAIPKIYHCLSISGRYDCVVANGWYRGLKYRLSLKLETIGIQLGEWREDRYYRI